MSRFNVIRNIFFLFVLFLVAGCVETFPAFPKMGTDAAPKNVEEVEVKSEATVQASSKPSFVYHRKVSSEKLLSADGDFNVEEQGRTYDPAQAHLEARKKVNTRRRRTDKNLSAHFEPDAKSGEDGKVRILRVKKGRGGNNDTYAQRLPQKEDSGFFDKVTSIFDDDGTAKRATSAERKHTVHAIHAIRPPALPKRKRPKAAISLEGEHIIPKRKPSVSSKRLKSIRASSSASQKMNSKGAVQKIRAGVYNGNARFVIEMSERNPYKTKIDPLRNVLLVKLENMDWTIDPKGNVSNSALLGGYVTRSLPDGNILLEVRLKKKAKVIEDTILEPNTTSGHRIVIDLKEM